MALARQPFISVEAYLQLDRTSTEGRYEYIDGQVRMLAGGTLNHATIGANIHRLLRQSLRGSFCRAYTSDVRVRLSETRYVYPDVTVTCDERDRGEVDIIQSPRVVVEVLSPSTADYDRGRKFTYYRDCPTLQEYVLVNTDYQAVEVFRREKKDLWVLQIFQLDNDVALISLDVHFPVSAVYEDVTFSSPAGGDQPA